MNQITNPPQTLYRVQHSTSFTKYDDVKGFEANGHYATDYSEWINLSKVQNHLDPNDKSCEPSPFISLFENFMDVERLADFHRCYKEDVFVAKVYTSDFVQYSFSIKYPDSERSVTLSGFIHPGTGTIVLPLHDVGQKLGIEYAKVQRSEWLALDYVPAELISRMS